jgi:hypothetical protein
MSELCGGSLTVERPIPIGYGGSTPTPSLQIFNVREISSLEARQVVEKYHYSRKMPKIHGFCFGGFIGDKLYVVAAYGDNPVNRNTVKWLGRVTKFSVTNFNFLELSRLARIEPKDDRLPLSLFLSVCHKILRKKGYKYILSYSDPEHNPSGGIYVASNFILLGTSKFTAHHFTDKEGKRISWRWLTQWAGRQKPPVSFEKAQHILGLMKSKKRSLPKKQWFLTLDKKERASLVLLDTRAKVLTPISTRTCANGRPKGEKC